MDDEHAIIEGYLRDHLVGLLDNLHPDDELELLARWYVSDGTNLIPSGVFEDPPLKFRQEAVLGIVKELKAKQAFDAVWRKVVRGMMGLASDSTNTTPAPPTRPQPPPETQVPTATLAPRSHRRLGTGLYGFYLFLLVLVIAFTALLVVKGFAQKPQVEIEFNVGELIGGFLAGAGAAAAGGAYAYKTIKELGDRGV